MFYGNTSEAQPSASQTGASVLRELSAAEIDEVSGGIAPLAVAAYIGGAFVTGFVAKAGATLYDNMFGDPCCC